MTSKHPINQKQTLAQYRAVYEAYNTQCNTLSEQNRGGRYATGYRCLINFCTAYHRGHTKGYRFETSYAMMAQDWGLSMSAKSIKRHLLRLSQEVITLNPCQHQAIVLPLFSQLKEIKRRGLLHVKLHLHPSFIVFENRELQALYQQASMGLNASP